MFNRSHYEDVLVVRVHKLVPKPVWQARYDLINDLEKLLHVENDTTILKFFLYISKEEQLARFKERLDDPARQWKISASDYTERDYWDDYIEAFEDALSHCSKKHAPWYVIPSNHKWFRNLAVSQIIADTMEDMRLKTAQSRPSTSPRSAGFTIGRSRARRRAARAPSAPSAGRRPLDSRAGERGGVRCPRKSCWRG